MGTVPANATNTRYIFRGGCSMEHPKYPCFCILSLEFVVNIDIQNMKTVKFYVQPAINHHMKCLGTPDYKYMENMSVDFI